MAFEQVNRAALNAYPGLLNAILPGGRVQGREFVCGDLSGKSGRSLSINLDRGVWRDFARGDSGSDPVSLWAAAHGCSQSEAARILAAQLGLSDERSACTPKRAAARAKQVLVEADKVPDKIVHPTLGQPAAFWVYHHQQGRVLGLVCRWDHPGGKKTIRPFTPVRNANGDIAWQWAGWHLPRPLYGLDRLAAHPDAPVLAVEGEKAADAAQKLFPDMAAITWPHGAESASKADFSPLQGRTVYVWPDSDEPGHRAAQTVCVAALAAGAVEVLKVAPPEGVADGWDLADALAEGWTPERAANWLRIHSARPVEGLQECCHAATPVPLPELPPVEPFEPKLLPEQLCPWIQDIADRLQCPIDYVAVGAMVHLAAVVGRKIGIRPQEKTNWTVVPNLWGLIVGRPGVMKSPALEATSGPLDRLIAEALEDYERSKNEALAAKAASDLRFEARQKEARKLLSQNHDADVSGLLIKDEIEEPTLRRYKTNDTTAASLGEVLRANPNGVLVFRDEMVSLLKGLDREDNADQRGFFLTAWNGDSSYTLDRIGRGLHLHIEACCISLLGGTQPARLSGYVAQAVKGGAGDDGLIQRFGLMVWPDVSPDWQNVDRPPDADAKKKAYEVFDRLGKLDPFSIGAEQDVGFDGDPEGIPYLRFDPDALALFNEWRADLERKVRSDDLHPALESHFAKYRKLVPALALITHLVDGETGPVTESSTLKALAWAEYLESHARRCYSAVTQEEVRAAREIKKKIANGALKPPFSSRDVWRPRWAGLDRNAAASGLAMLVDYGHLLIKTVETEGRSATLYYVAGGSA